MRKQQHDFWREPEAGILSWEFYMRSCSSGPAERAQRSEHPGRPSSLMQAGSSTKQVGGPAEVYTRYPDDLEAQTLEATGVQKVDVVAHGSAAIKAAFIRKVYTILSMQLKTKR